MRTIRRTASAHSFLAWLLAAALLVLPVAAWSYAEFTIDGVGNETSPAVAYSIATERFLVVWVSDAAGRREIMGQFFSVDGKGLEEPFAIGVSAFDAFEPDVIYDDTSGRYFVSWLYDFNGDGSDLDIRGRIVPDAGLDPALPARDLVATTSSQTQPEITRWTSDNNGLVRFLVVWRDGADGTLRGKIIESDGLPAATETILVTPGAGKTVEDPQLPDYFSGGVPALMTYTERGANGEGDIYAARLLAPLNAANTDVTVDDSRFGISAFLGNEEDADVTFTPAGNWQVTWIGGSPGRVYSRIVTRDGDRGAIEQSFFVVGADSWPQIKAGLGEHLVVQGAVSEVVPGEFQIWLEMKDLQGFPAGTRRIISPYDASFQTASARLRLAMSSLADRGTATALWQEDDAATGGSRIAGFTADFRIPTSERQALLDFFVSTDGGNWLTSPNWGLPVGSECTWYGVSCLSSGEHVNALFLRAHNLVGTLPDTLGDLTRLESLGIPSNRVGGAIPSSLFELSRLEYLLLGDNELSGPIPSPALGQWPALRSLYLDQNRFTGTIPASLTMLPVLEELSLRGNPLEGTLPEPGPGQWQELSRLDAGKSGLAGPIPEALLRLPMLKLVFLDSNDFSGPLPMRVPADWPNAEFLYLNGNRFTGPIPAELANRDLLSLDLSDNDLTGLLPPGLLSMDNLVFLGLANNALSGELPRPMPGQWPGLTALDLSRNRFRGAIPPELGHLPPTVLLQLASNALVGNIPPELVQLTNAAFDFSYNALQTDDPVVDAHVSQAHGTPTWVDSQTVPPDNVRLETRTDRGVIVAWDPVADPLKLPGRYRVWYRLTGDGWTTAGETSSKSIGRFPITGLVPSNAYEFAVTTLTEAHPANANALQSAFSGTFVDSTQPECGEPPEIMATAGNPNTLLEVADVYANYQWSTGGTQAFETVPSDLDDWVYLVAQTPSGCSTLSAIYVPVEVIFANGYED